MSVKTLRQKTRASLHRRGEKKTKHHESVRSSGLVKTRRAEIEKSDTTGI